MKKLVIAIGVVVLLVVVAALVVPPLIPLDTYKTLIEERVAEATGRRLTIAGDIKLSLVPAIEIEIADVSFANPEGAAEPDMATIGKLVLALKLAPLLGGAIEIDRFVLVDPVLRLDADVGGRPNWEFAGKAESKETKETKETGAAGAALADLRLGDVRLVNGTIDYRDPSGKVTALDKVEATISLDDLASPLALDAGLTYNGERLDLMARLETPESLRAVEAAKATISLKGAPLSLSFSGEIALADKPRADGDLSLDIPSLRKLAAWAGTPLAIAGSGFEGFNLKGKLAAIGSRYALNGITLRFDDIAGNGDLVFDLGGERPKVTAALDVETLDLTPYLPPEGGGAAPADTNANAGAEATAGWSDEPIDFSGLRAVDADLTFGASAVIARRIVIGRSIVTLKLVGGDLRLDMPEMILYGGKGTLAARIDARGDIPSFAKTVRVSGVDAAPLLAAAAGFDRLEGTAEITLAITAKGRSQREIVASLAGKGGAKFLDGAIRGINLGAMLRNVTTAFTAGDDAQKTDFAELSGTFVIKQGIVVNRDLTLLAPLLRVKGAGTVDLPARRVDYRIEPKLAATAEGQGGQANVAGVMVPVIVEGPWSKLAYKPDLTGLIGDAAKNPAKLLDAAKGAAKGITGGAGTLKEGATDQLKGLLGGATAPSSGGTAAPDPLGAVKNLFGN